MKKLTKVMGEREREEKKEMSQWCSSLLKIEGERFSETALFS